MRGAQAQPPSPAPHCVRGTLSRKREREGAYLGKEKGACFTESAGAPRPGSAVVCLMRALRQHGTGGGRPRQLRGREGKPERRKDQDDKQKAKIGETTEFLRRDDVLADVRAPFMRAAHVQAFAHEKPPVPRGDDPECSSPARCPADSEA